MHAKDYFSSLGEEGKDFNENEKWVTWWRLSQGHLSALDILEAPKFSKKLNSLSHAVISGNAADVSRNVHDFFSAVHARSAGGEFP